MNIKHDVELILEAYDNIQNNEKSIDYSAQAANDLKKFVDDGYLEDILIGDDTFNDLVDNYAYEAEYDRGEPRTWEDPGYSAGYIYNNEEFTDDEAKYIAKQLFDEWIKTPEEFNISYPNEKSYINEYINELTKHIQGYSSKYISDKIDFRNENL